MNGVQTSTLICSYLGVHPFIFDSHCVVVWMILCLTVRTDTHLVCPTVNLKSVRESSALSDSRTSTGPQIHTSILLMPQ